MERNPSMEKSSAEYCVIMGPGGMERAARHLTSLNKEQPIALEGMERSTTHLDLYCFLYYNGT